MRFVPVPPTVDIIDIAGRKLGTCDFAHSIKTAASAATLLTLPGVATSKYKAQSLRDVVALFAGKQPGDVVPCPDEMLAPIAEVMENPPPSVFMPAWVMCAEAHQRAVLDAGSQPPVEKTTNGHAEASASVS